MRTVQLMGRMPKGTRHSILAMDGRSGCLERVPGGVEVKLLPTPGALSFFAMSGYMRKLLEREAPDAVMTYNWGAIEMVLGARRGGFSKVIHHEDGFGLEEARRRLRRRNWIRRLLLRKVAAVAVPSKVLAGLAIETWRVPSDKLHYLPNGVDLDRFRPAAEKSSPPVVGHVGHLRPEKQQSLLITAFARCRSDSARLRIIGGGVERERLVSLASDLGVGDRVDFVGEVPDTAPQYREMSLFALSSATEQMPLTVLEAMASGLPVVSTQVGDILSMVHVSNREFVCPGGDASALADALDRILGDAGLRREVGRANRQRCEDEFDSERCYGAWIELYERVLAG